MDAATELALVLQAIRCGFATHLPNARRSRLLGERIIHASKTDAAMKNEVLCKLLSHNLCCLIQEQEELGIAPIFWKNEATYPGNEPVSQLPPVSRN